MHRILFEPKATCEEVGGAKRPAEWPWALFSVCVSVCTPGRNNSTHLLVLPFGEKEIRYEKPYQRAWHTMLELIALNIHNLKFKLLGLHIKENTLSETADVT